MKSMATGHILKSKTVSATDCLHYALSLPTSFVITGIDSTTILDQAFQAASSLFSVSRDQIASILKKTEPAAADGRFEPIKTSAIFDSTAMHPEWLGYNPQT